MRVLAVGLAVTLVVTLGTPAQNVTRFGPVHLSWGRLLSWLNAPGAWAAPPVPLTPHQQTGTAPRAPRQADSSATRRGGGAGHPPGPGIGELPAFSPHSGSAKQATTGTLGDGSASFNPATSRRVAASATATSDLYQNADGSYTRIVSAAARNYRGADSAWHPIDTTLSAAADGRLHVAADASGTQFAEAADDPSLVSLRLDAGHTLAYGLGGAAHVAGVVSGSGVTYPGALPHTDLRVDALPGGPEVSLVLNSAQAPSSWTFPLRLGGLTARLSPEGTVQMVDGSGTVVGTVARAYLRDSAVNPRSGGPAESHAVDYGLTTVDGQQVLTMTADAGWLHDPSRVYPVTVDPSYTAGSTGTTYVLSDQSGDFSGDYDMDIGSWNNGGEIGQAYLAFSGLGGALSGMRITSASLKVFDYWASTCTPERFDVAAVTQSWSVAGSKSWSSRPSIGSSIGNLTADPGAACTNTPGYSTVGVWMTVGLGTSTFNSWTTGGADYGLALSAAGSSNVSWKRFDTVNSPNPPQLILNYTPDQAPQIDTMYPPTNYNAPTLTPELIALGHDPDSWPSPLTYTFTVYSSSGATLATSGAISGNSWVVPAGKLTWSQTYYWSALAYDGVTYSTTTSASYFTTTVPQPLVTSGLAQNTGEHGFDPAAGNYTTSVSDAQVQTVGPALSVQRAYNSLDPRTTQAFGTGWSSLYDMRAVEVRDPTGAVTGVIVTYPTGEEVEFGRNADGTFAPPQGRFATLTALSPGYKLVDKNGTTYTFDQATTTAGSYGIGSIADFQGRTESFAYTGGVLSTATSVVSGRTLHFTWTTPSGATGPHVASVVTDPATPGASSTALTWTYSYSGDRLTSVCPPGTTTACTGYSYTGGSHYRTTVVDAGPRDYWRLADPAGGTTATDQMLINENTLNGTYTAATIPGGPAGPLNDGLSSASFNGTDAALKLPDSLITGATYLSVGLWFKTTATTTGTLFSTGNSAPGTANPSSAAMPVLYVGSDGKLYGHFWNNTTAGISSSTVVRDGRWHYAVLTAAGNTQTLYLDGTQVGSPLTGQINNIDPYDMIGAGVYNNNGWPAAPSGNVWNYFNGQIAEVAYYTHPLTAPVVAAQWAASTGQANLLTGITKPSGKTDTTVAYHTADDNVATVTDVNGGTWTVGQPSVTGSSQTYAGAVMGSGPLDYYRFGESGVSQAVNQVRGGTANYNAVTLGVGGAFGSGDDTAASLNGTSSYVQLPTNVFPSGASSQELWFNTTGTNKVLLSTQTGAIGTTTCPCTPVLWISDDGKLRGLSPSTSPSGPFHAKTLGNLCMDVSGQATANGTKIQVWDCQNANVGQDWTLYPDGSVRALGKCLDLNGYGTTNGTKVQLWDCTGASNQVWQPYNGGLRNPVSGRCLDDPSSSTTKGTQFQLYDCNGSGAQLWTQSLVSSGAVNDGKWHHAVLTTDGKAQSLYLDGARVNSTNGQVPLTPPALPYTYLGAGYTGVTTAGLPANTSEYFAGSLDEAAFYTSTLTAADVARHWAAYKSAFGIAPVQTVQVIDPAGKVLTYTFDPQNGERPLSTVDGLGDKTTYGYDTSGFLHTVTDPNGDVTTTGHDVRGNMVSQTTCQNQASAICSTTYYTYYPDDTSASPPADQRNDLVLTVRDGRSSSATDPSYLTTYTYDAAGNKTSTTTPPVSGFPGGRTSTTTYTDGHTQTGADGGFAPAGLVASATTPGGATETVTYYQNGDPASVTDPAGVTTRYTYDGLGRVLTKTVVSDSYPGGLTTSYTYDGQNRPVTITDPPVTDRVTGAIHTARTTDVYDADGDTLSTSVADLTGGDATRTVSNTFDPGDRVATATTAAGATTSYTYDAYGNRASETDPAGDTTAYTYDANRHLLTTTLKNYRGDPANPGAPADLVQSARAYDPAGRLATVTDSMGWVTAYTYYDNGLTATVTRKDPSSGASFVQQSNTYDAAGNLVGRLTNNNTTNTVYTVDGAGRTAAATLDPSGVDRTTSYGYSADDFVTSTRISDASGTLAVTDATFDALGRQTSTTVHNDTAGHPVGWWPLADGTGLGAADSSGSGHTGILSGAVSLSSGTATFNGTAAGISTGVPVVDTSKSFSISVWTDPATLGTAWQGLVTAQGTQNGVYLEYDAGAGKWGFSRALTDTTSPSFAHAYSTSPAQSGVWTHLVATYNAGTGAMTLYVNGTANGTATDTTPLHATGPLVIGHGFYNGAAVNYANGAIADLQVYDRALSASEVATLDGYGRGGAALDTSLLTTRWTLDQRGLPTSSTDPAGNTTTYGYDEAGKQAVVVAPTVTSEVSGQPAIAVHPITTTGYDTFGEPVETSDPNGNVTIAGYDASGRVLSTTLPAYTPPGSGSAVTPVAHKAYDNMGQLITATDPLGNQTHYVYDQLGDLATVTDPAAGVTHYTYDTDGDRLSSTDPTGAQSQSTYDFLGRQLTVTSLVRQDGTAYTTTNSYTLPGGYLTSTTSANGVATSYGYDAVGENTTVTDGAANTTTFRYDGLGRKVATVLPDHTSSTATFDEAGRQTGTASLDAGGATLRTSSAEYDADGNLVSSTDPLGNTTSFSYDATGAMTRESQPVSAGTSIVTSFGYDAAGNRTRFTDGRGNSFMTTYNVWNLPESSIEPSTPDHPAGADRTFTVGYDAAGRVASQTSPGGVVVTDTYDSRGNLTQQTGTGAEAATTAHTYGYDAAGRMTSAGGDTFTYDDRGLLRNTAGPSGTASFAYNPDGQLASRTDAAGTSTYTYDTAGRVHTVADASTAAAISYGYNADGLLASVNYGAGRANQAYTYNALHQLTGDTLTNGSGGVEASIAYGYDVDGNETSKTTTGVAGATTNTYTYDEAGRLTSWNNGTTTLAYGYDLSGNRTQVGAKTYTYDARDELTSDGTNAYTYTARGTLASTAGAGAATETSDAFNRVITDGSQTYTYDALDRVLTRPGNAFSYSGPGNTPASDGVYTYSQGPGGSVVGVAQSGSAALVLTDQHTDVVGQFTPGAASLNGSTTYDPLGNVTATVGMLGNLGYQSGWTDPGTNKVDMAARWYNPAVGQFTSRDTVANPAAPTSVAANRFQYGNDNPLIGTDPTGHCDWWNVVCGAQQAVNTVKQVAVSTWNTVTTVATNAWNTVSSAAVNFYHAATQFVSNAWNTAVHVVTTVVNKVADAYNNVKTWVNNTVTNTVNWVKQTATTVWHAAVYTYQHPAEALKYAAQATGTFLKAHAADIASFIASTAVFMGCEAALGVVTAGVGAVAGAVACGALSGAVGSAVTYGMTTPMSKWNLGDAAKAVGMGALTGAAGSLLGAAGGKLIATFGSKILGPVLDSVASRLGPAALEDAATTVTEDVVDTAATDVAETGAEEAASTTTKEAASTAEPHGGTEPEPASEPASEPKESNPCHSFDGSTPVLMADGTSKPIGDVKLGDKVTSTDPQTGKGTAEPVVALHDNHDTDLADVTVQAKDGKSTTLHTTWHHPFWNATAHEWTDAADLKPGTALHVWDGDDYAVKVVSVKTWTGLHEMHDLTVAQIHTYYVLAAGVPVLVHNNGPYCDADKGGGSGGGSSGKGAGRSSGWPKPNASNNNCAQCANAIQKKIGGRVVRFDPPDGAPYLGPSTNNPAGDWSYHVVVLLQDRVYDAFTGPSGLGVDAFKAQFRYAQWISFGF